MIIGIVGLGYVGTATAAVMSRATDVLGYDLRSGCHCFPRDGRKPAMSFSSEMYPEHGSQYQENIAWLVREAHDAIFVCVPTPMKADGSCDTSIVEGVVQAIGIASWPNRLSRLVAIKSTVPPGTTAKLAQQWPNLSVAFCPEFLRESSAIEDALAEKRVIIGTRCPESPAIKRLAALYMEALPGVVVHKTTPTTAEMVKYATNVFLASKVSLANELCEICTALGINYQDMITLAVEDSRLGTSHWQVSGPDLRSGWGGSCFPKDVNALIHKAKELGVRPTMMEAAWQKNLEVRPERDWEQLVGRAVVASTPPPFVHSEVAMGVFGAHAAQSDLDHSP